MRQMSVSRAAAFCIALAVWLGAPSVRAVTSDLATLDGQSLASALDQTDVLTKPDGWLRFDEICAFGSSFSVILDRAKRPGGRVIVRSLTGDPDGDLYRQDLPSALGVECIPYSVGYD